MLEMESSPGHLDSDALLLTFLTVALMINVHHCIQLLVEMGFHELFAQDGLEL
jgi:hypothetical protein